MTLAALSAVPRFQSGGPIRAGGALYVERPADQQLLAQLEQGELCYILAPRQIGKTSLRVRTAHQLRARGLRCAAIDLSQIGRSSGEDAWYSGLVHEISRELDLPEDLAERFWLSNRRHSPVHRLGRFLREEVLEREQGSIVVFLDEIEQVRALPFSADDFFAALRAAHNKRADDPEFRRLTFCLLGVAAPGELIKNPLLTPFNIGQGLRLEDFTPAQARAFLPGLLGAEDDPQALLDLVLEWTDGHPYMTQRICKELIEQGDRSPPQERVERAVLKTFIRSGRTQDQNLQWAERYFASRPDTEKPMLLSLYQRLLAGESVPVEEADPTQIQLQLAGMIAARGGRLRVRNQIYANVFDERWVAERDHELRWIRPMERWKENGRTSIYLLRGQDLEKYRGWAQENVERMGPEQLQFLIASLEEARNQEERQHQQAREGLETEQAQRKQEQEAVRRLTEKAEELDRLGREAVALRKAREQELEGALAALRASVGRDAARREDMLRRQRQTVFVLALCVGLALAAAYGVSIGAMNWSKPEGVWSVVIRALLIILPMGAVGVASWVFRRNARLLQVIKDRYQDLQHQIDQRNRLLSKGEHELHVMHQELVRLRDALERRPSLQRVVYNIALLGIGACGKTALGMKLVNPIFELERLVATKFARYEKPVSRQLGPSNTMTEHVFEFLDWGESYLEDAQTALMKIPSISAAIFVVGVDSDEDQMRRQMETFGEHTLRFFVAPMIVEHCKTFVLFINKSDILAGTLQDVERTARDLYRPLIDSFARLCERSGVDFTAIVGSAMSGHSLPHLYGHLIRRILPEEAYDEALLRFKP